MKFVTLGVYGTTEEHFFQSLQQAGVDTFCDIRWRRGVRGAQYAFVNSARLQERLARLNIRYFHFRDLAPSPALRQRQTRADQADRVAKRQRTELAPVFADGYQSEVLSQFAPREFVQKLEPARIVALFCVERDPRACHRSLVADKLRSELGVETEHLLPCATDL